MLLLNDHAIQTGATSNLSSILSAIPGTLRYFQFSVLLALQSIEIQGKHCKTESFTGIPK